MLLNQYCFVLGTYEPRIEDLDDFESGSSESTESEEDIQVINFFVYI